MKPDRASRIHRLVNEVIYDLEHPAPTIPTGLPRLDGFLDGGLRAGEVFVLAARPRLGKSAFALQIALQAAADGLGVAIWSLEMAPKQWIRRAIASLSGVNPKLIRRGGDSLSTDDVTLVSQAMGRLKELPLFFADVERDFESEAERMKIGGCSLLLIDYLQLMEPPSGAFSRENEVSVLSRMFKRMAIALDIPILLLAQLNRNAEGKVPTLGDLRESGAVEQDADEVFFLHRDPDPDTHILRDHGIGILAKNRDGESGVVRLTYDWRHYQFHEAP